MRYRRADFCLSRVSSNRVSSRLRLFLRQICLLAGRVDNQGRLGRGEGIRGELGTRARRARSRHQPGDTGERPLQGGGTGTTGVICAHSAEIRRRIGNSVLVAQCGNQGQPTRALVRGVTRAVFGEPTTIPITTSLCVTVCGPQGARAMASSRGILNIQSLNELTSEKG
jgi:hypothetical protein